MCLMPTRKGKSTGTHTLIRKPVIHTVTVDRKKLDAIAEALGISPAERRKLKPGKLHLVNEAKKAKR